VLLGATIFSLAGFVNAVYAKKFDDIALVPTFILTPLTYLGGVFYSVNMLGEPWQAISRVNPILYMVNAFRFGVLGISDVNIGVAFVVMLASWSACRSWRCVAQARRRLALVTSSMRVNKYISESGLCSRREADELLLAGRVTINGEMVDMAPRRWMAMKCAWMARSCVARTLAPRWQQRKPSISR
jgi:hypothetical protein